MSVNRINPPATRGDVLEAGRAVHDKLARDLKVLVAAAVKSATTDLETRLRATEDRCERRLDAATKRLEEREQHWQQKLLEQRDHYAKQLDQARDESARTAGDLRGLVKSITALPGGGGDTEMVVRVAKMLEDKIAVVQGRVKELGDALESFRGDYAGGKALVKALVEALPAPVITVTPAEVNIPPAVVNVPAPVVNVDVKPTDVSLPAPVVNNILPELNVPAPVVNVAGPEIKGLPAPQVNVSVPRRKMVKSIEYDQHGRPAQIIETEVEDK